jgi:uncharacterized protein YdaU (DUF1376 family)
VPALKYYKRHIGDWMKKTSHLDFLEDAAYSRLVDLYYDREAPVPDAEAERLVRARSAAEKKAVRRVLGEFFTLVDGGWRHGHCDEEIGKYQTQAEANRDNGKKGGRPPKQTKVVTEQKPGNNPSGFDLESEKNLNPRIQESTNSKSGFAASVPDLRARLFDIGKELLGADSGSLIAKAIKHCGEQKVGEVLGQMALSTKAEPVRYFAAATMPKPKRVAL